MSGRSNCKSRNNTRFATNYIWTGYELRYQLARFQAIWAEAQKPGHCSTAESEGRAGLPVKVHHDVGHGFDQHTAPVVRRGVFAAPTVFARDEIFLCNDHFDFIEEALRKFI